MERRFIIKERGKRVDSLEQKLSNRRHGKHDAGYCEYNVVLVLFVKITGFRHLGVTFEWAAENDFYVCSFFQALL